MDLGGYHRSQLKSGQVVEYANRLRSFFQENDKDARLNAERSKVHFDKLGKHSPHSIIKDKLGPYSRRYGLRIDFNSQWVECFLYYQKKHYNTWYGWLWIPYLFASRIIFFSSNSCFSFAITSQQNISHTLNMSTFWLALL